MLLFSTILEINDTMSKDDFIRLAIEWNQGSPHENNRIPNMIWNGERNIKFGTDTLSMTIEEYRNRNIIAIRYEKTETDGVVWCTDYVMNFTEKRLSIRLDRSFLESALSVDPKFSTPHFISCLIEHDYLKSDGDLPVSNRPILIDASNVDILSGVINGDRRYQLPVVYISKTYYDEDPVDTRAIAGRLKGVAHVLVQKERWSNGMIRRLCDSKNEYLGAIGVYFPNQAAGHRTYLYRAYDGMDAIMMEKVIRSVIQYSNAQMVDTLYTWTGVSNALLRDKYSSKEADRVAAELAVKQARNDADDLIASVDEELRELREQVERLTKQNDALTYENQGLRAKIDATEDIALLYFGEEDEFFQGEIKEMILSAIAEKLKNTTPKTRKHDVLSDILQKNEFEGVAEKRADVIKTLLNGYKNMTSSVRQTLLDLGFTITEEGKHYRLTYFGDNRYKTTIAKTGSDHREGKNIAATIIRDMF